MSPWFRESAPAVLISGVCARSQRGCVESMYAAKVASQCSPA
jgi:hypothetical protein